MADDNHIVPAHAGTVPPTPSTQPGLNGPTGVPPTARAAGDARRRTPPPPVESKDALREGVETIVFVVVLVLLLKTFIAEAFVIPTGSMAPTLYGYQKDVTCPQCGYT